MMLRRQHGSICSAAAVETRAAVSDRLAATSPRRAVACLRQCTCVMGIAGLHAGPAPGGRFARFGHRGQPRKLCCCAVGAAGQGVAAAPAASCSGQAQGMRACVLLGGRRGSGTGFDGRDARSRNDDLSCSAGPRGWLPYRHHRRVCSTATVVKRKLIHPHLHVSYVHNS